MAKVANFYLELLKILIITILFFAIFGNINDQIVTFISPQSSTIVHLMEQQLVFQVVFFGQFIGSIILIWIVYRNWKSIVSWIKTKNEQGPLKDSTWLSFYSALGLILFPYVCLFIS